MTATLVTRSAARTLLALLGAIVLATASGAEATPADKRARQIYVEDFVPSWSPDGRQIVFVRVRGVRDPQNSEFVITLSEALYVVNADGMGLRRIRGSGNDSDPAWSPNGRWIAFNRRNRLWVMRPDGTDVRIVRRDVAENRLPSWAPAGDRIAFWRGRLRKFTGAIYVVRPDGSGFRRIVTRADLYGGPSWSPDGRRLAFVRNLEIWVVAANGSDAHVVSQGGPPPYPKRFSTYYEPAWSPDGTRLAFRSDLGVFVMNADGTGIRRITRSPNELNQDSHPQWSPDGRRIVFAGYRGGSEEARIYVVAANGRRLTRLTNAPRR